MRCALLGLVALIACGGGGSAPAEPTTPGEVEASEAVAEATSVIGEVHASIKRGSPQGILPLLATELWVAAPDGQIFVDRSAAVVALSEIFEGKKHKVRAKNLQVVAAPRGHSAWATEQLEIDGRAYLITAILANIDDFWVITAVHVAEPVPDKKVKKAVEAGTMPRPPALTPGAGETAALVDAFVAAASGRDAMMEAIVDRKDAVVLGSAPGELTRGAKKIKKMWKKSLKKSPTIAVVGEVRATITPDGQTGWVCAAVDLATKGGAPIPHRGFYVFEAGEAGDWQLVAAHEAVLRLPVK
jgi:ketosteroid isomerase-like protein